MDISIVTLTWNSEAYVEKCLDTLTRAIENKYKYEIFVVDNGSIDKTTALLKSFKQKIGPNFKPIFLDANYGTTYSRNFALKRANGQFIIIMDSDVEIVNGAITKLIQLLERNPKAGIIAPRLIYPDGRHQKSTDAFPTLISKILRYLFLRLIEKKENITKFKQGIQEVDYAISAMWIMRQEVLGKVGLLDENIFYAPEDVDYCLRIWKAGYRVLYAPEVTCIHHTQEISRGFKINRATLEHIRGLIYYFRKHGYLLKRPNFS